MDKTALTPKKKMIVLAVCAAVLLLFLYFSTYLSPTGEQASDMNAELEEKLENALSEMKGVGDVRVVINYRNTAQIQTAEKNGESFFEESEPAFAEQFPEVCGVLVVAEGAEDIRVRTEMIGAVAALMDVSVDQIEILY